MPFRLRESHLFVYLGCPITWRMQIFVSSVVHLFSTCWKCELSGWFMNVMAGSRLLHYLIMILWPSVIMQDRGIGGSLQYINQAWWTKISRFFLQAFQWKAFFISWGDFALYGCLCSLSHWHSHVKVCSLFLSVCFFVHRRRPAACFSL